MKRLLFTLLALATVLSFNGCSRDEKTAIEEFKKDFAAWKASVAELKKSSKNDPAAESKAMNEAVAKAKAIKTDGLPADLKDPWVGAVGDIEKITAIMTDTTIDPAKPDPAKLAKMEETSKQLDADQKKLADAEKKYGIEGLSKLGE